jgi:hypothetical protein
MLAAGFVLVKIRRKTKQLAAVAHEISRCNIFVFNGNSSSYPYEKTGVLDFSSYKKKEFPQKTTYEIIVS